MVNLYIENQRCDLEGKETIATSYAIAPFSDVGKRTSNASINFKLPLTANNRTIFENNNVVVNASTLPYRYLSARLDVDGIDQKIRSAQLISIKDSIEIKLLGGNIDFFAAIKELKLSDIDTSSLNHLWNLSNVVASAANTSGYVYALIDTYTDSPNTFIDNVSNQIDVRGLLPSVFLHSIISQIVTDAGFTASGNFLTNTDYRSIIIPCVSKIIGSYKNQLLSTGDITSDEVLNFLGGNIYIDWIDTYDPLSLLESDTYSVNYDGVIVPVQTLVRYLIYISGEYNFRVSFDYDNNSNILGNRVWLVRQSGAGAFNLIEEQSMTGVSGSILFSVENIACDEDDVIHVLFPDVAFNSDTVDILSGAEFAVTETSVEETEFGKYFDIQANLPDIKQSDVMKALAQQFGLMYAVDNDNMIVYFRQFSEIVANKPNAKDWSDKVDYSEKTEVNFSDTSYGQINHCEYAEDETVIKPSGTDYDILIGNKTLKPEYKLFELPYAASEQVLRMLDHSIAQIKIFTNYDTTDEEVNEVTPRVLIRRMQSFSPALDYTDGTTTTAVISVPLTHFILFGQTFNLGFEDNLLPTYSQDIIDVIQNFKLINLLLRINVVDINQLDFFIPVWVERKNEAGAYFYLSEIKQFKSTSKESSETELVLLP